MKWYHWTIITLILLMLTQQACSDREKDSLKSQITMLSLNKQKNDSIINKQGEVIYTQEVAITKSKEELKKYTDSIFNLNRRHERKIKEVTAFYKNRYRVQLDSFFVYEVDSIPYPEYITVEFMNDSMITVPRTFKVDEPYFKLDATVRKNGLMINSLSLPDTLYGRIVTKKQGFLKPKIKEYQYFNKNPYVIQEGSNSVIYEDKKKFWNKVRDGAILVGAGFLIGSQL